MDLQNKRPGPRTDTNYTSKENKMQYEGVTKGIFLARPNRFVAQVQLPQGQVTAHVKNTGRCKELLVPGTAVWLEPGKTPGRKTPWDLVTVEKEGRLFNLDSQAPNKVFGEWARSGGFVENLDLLRPETVYGDSRFDFYWQAGQRKGFVEVKGVTLEREGVLYFPDAPTQRGIRHLQQLALCRREGYEAAVCFVIQTDQARYFSPNPDRPEFAQALRQAAAAGVQVLAVRCAVTPDSLSIREAVEVRL